VKSHGVPQYYAKICRSVKRKLYLHGRPHGTGPAGPEDLPSVTPCRRGLAVKFKSRGTDGQLMCNGGYWMYGKSNAERRLDGGEHTTDHGGQPLSPGSTPTPAQLSRPPTSSRRMHCTTKLPGIRDPVQGSIRWVQFHDSTGTAFLPPSTQ
jgi:hypothetical protein